MFAIRKDVGLENGSSWISLPMFAPAFAFRDYIPCNAIPIHKIAVCIMHLHVYNLMYLGEFQK